MWDDIRTSQLKTWANQGLSAGQIVEAFGGIFTRNAIISKTSRIGVKLKGGPSGAFNKPEKPPKPQRAARKPVKRAKPLRMPKNPIEPPQEPVDASGAVSILNLTLCSCRWPLDVVSDWPMYCGAVSMEDGPYCQEHHSVAYVKPTVTVRHLERSLRKFS